MKNPFLIIAILVLPVLQLFAADNSAAFWAKGNEFYHQKQYDSAAVYYEKIAALKSQNAELYYNLGNSYYRLNKIGSAVLNYERALQINPDYKDAQDNLLLTKSRISTHIPQANDIFFINWWEGITRSDKATNWAVWALITFLAVVALTMLMYFRKLNIPAQIPGIIGFVWICFMVLAYFSAEKHHNSHMAVVMQNDAPLVNMEQRSGKPVSLLPEGTTVRTGAIKGDYVEITLPDGRRGWIEQSWIAKV